MKKLSKTQGIHTQLNVWLTWSLSHLSYHSNYQNNPHKSLEEPLRGIIASMKTTVLY